MLAIVAKFSAEPICEVLVNSSDVDDVDDHADGAGTDKTTHPEEPDPPPF
jgi:hypothetical protein